MVNRRYRMISPIFALCLGTALAGEPKWSYLESQDKMRGQMTRSAEVESTNALRLNSPYSGSAIVRMRLSKEDGKKDTTIFFETSKGFFRCFSNCVFDYKADEGKVRRVGAGGLTGNKVIWVYMRDGGGGDRLLSDLRKAKKITVELPLHDGRYQFEFATEGLKWQ